MRIGALKRLLQGTVAFEREVAAEKGEFSLFALVEKDNWPGERPTWHLFVGAPWVWADEYAAWEYLRERMRRHVPRLDFGFYPHIEVARPDSPDLDEVWEYCGTEGGMVEIYDVEIFNVTAKRGYIFASRRPAELPQPQQPAAATSV